MTLEQISQFVDKVGFPVAVLIALGFFLYQCGKFLAPQVEKLVAATADNAAALKIADAKLDLNHASLEKALTEIRARVDQILEVVKREEGR
jgi:hypothetical protein